MSAQEKATATDEGNDNSGSKFQCVDCGATLMHLHRLKLHKQFHCRFGTARRGEMPDASKTCLFCNKRLRSDKSMRRHLIRECYVDKRHVCQMCGFVCFWHTDYQKHLFQKHRGVMEVLDEVTAITNGENRLGIGEMGYMVKAGRGKDDEETPLKPEESKSCLEEDLYLSDEDMEAQLYPDNFGNTHNAITEPLFEIPFAEDFIDLTNIDDADGLSKAETEAVQVDRKTTQTRSEIKKSISNSKPKSVKKEKKSKQEKAVKKDKKVKRLREGKKNKNCKKIKTENKKNDQHEESHFNNRSTSGKVEENMKNDMRSTDEEQMNEDAMAVTYLESSIPIMNLSLDQVLIDLPKISREAFERIKMENPEHISFEV